MGGMERWTREERGVEKGIRRGRRERIAWRRAGRKESGTVGRRDEKKEQDSGNKKKKGE